MDLRKVMRMTWVTISRMSTSGLIRLKTPRLSIASQAKIRAPIQISRTSQAHKIKVASSSQQKVTNNSTTMLSKTIQIKVIKLSISNSTTLTILATTAAAQPRQTNNSHLPKPTTPTPEATSHHHPHPTPTNQLLNNLSKTTARNSNNNSNSNATKHSRPLTLSKTDCTSTWQICWSTFTMARALKSIETTTPKSSAFWMSRRRSRKWTESSQ